MLIIYFDRALFLFTTSLNTLSDGYRSEQFHAVFGRRASKKVPAIVTFLAS